MTPVRVIGDADTVLAFALGGVPGEVVHGANEARAALDAALREVREAGGSVRNPSLLLMTSAAARLVRDSLDLITLDAGAPLVLEIPGFGEPLAEDPLTQFVEHVLGVNL